DLREADRRRAHATLPAPRKLAEPAPHMRGALRQLSCGDEGSRRLSTLPLDRLQVLAQRPAVRLTRSKLELGFCPFKQVAGQPLVKRAVSAEVSRICVTKLGLRSSRRDRFGSLNGSFGPRQP